NDDGNWRDVFGERRNTRLKDQELILRFLAMMERADQYYRPMRDFLNAFTAECSAPGEQKLTDMKNLFTETIRLCREAKGKSAFRPSRALNAAVYEAVMVGIAKRISASKKPPDIPSVSAAYDKLLANPKFMRACERATADEESVKTRQSLAVEAFKDV